MNRSGLTAAHDPAGTILYHKQEIKQGCAEGERI